MRRLYKKWLIRGAVCAIVAMGLSIALAVVAYTTAEFEPPRGRPQLVTCANASGVRWDRALSRSEMFVAGEIRCTPLPDAGWSIIQVSAGLSPQSRLVLNIEGPPLLSDEALCTQVVASLEAGQVYELERFGWPANWLTRSVVYSARVPPGQLITDYAVLRGADRGLAAVNVSGILPGNATEPVIPLGIEPIAFLLSVLAHMGLITLLWIGVRGVIYSRRSGRGRCTACAFQMDLSQSKCPECGHERTGLARYLVR